ncbi:helix-turn-helix domain-containing protein [Bacillus sp. ISL-18]|uniref:CdaR family transcriptional regulator n=1 Tax=Bacillus sp. ISL-18 TaxID=2819118 RepID=UPI001BEC2317|nr:sugar diacid recognition domain-containing protein [Bacillus sp. ISL-18]MBT2657152.1 helix-turn-helix domain-containing protein [Bacillus sp. ISL-18]
MKLSKPIAEKVTKEMMKVIPYNINLMDEKGLIIGSGDKKRIGILHKGATKVIATKSINEIYTEGDGMKPGVNEPIIVNGEIIGVIGITGDPDEVRPFSKLVGATAKLLIEQETINKKAQNDRIKRETFYHELSYRKTSYDEEFLQQGKMYGIDLTRNCQAILIKGNLHSKDIKAFFDRLRHYSTIDNSRRVLFITEHSSFEEVITYLLDRKEIEKVAIGEKEEFAALSLEQAADALTVGVKIKPSEKIYYYHHLRLFIDLASDHRDYPSNVLSVLEGSGNNQELFHTLQIYVEENGDINQTAKKLKIHRNTLNYRLEKIGDLTGKNPKVILELFELICSIIWYK